MIENQGTALKFYAFYTESKLGKTGLTVTVDVYRNDTEIVTAGSATEVGDGLYKYELASGSNNAAGEYVAVFKTATTTVDQRHIPALWVVDKAGVENLDATVSSRASQTSVNTIDDFLDTEIATLLTGVAAIEVDTQDLQSRVPAALVGGRIDANVGAISSDATAADNLEAVLDGTGGVTLVASAITLTTPITANATQISGDATAADNLEAAADGTGFNLGGGAVVAASVTGAVGSVTGNVGGNVTGSVGSLAAQAKADVNAEVLDVLATDTFAEVASVPAATSSLKDKINWLFAIARNKITQTATTWTLRNDADSASIATATVSDDGTTYTRTEAS